MIINVSKLHQELEDAGIQIQGCDSNGIVWDINGNEIQDREDVAAIIAAHDPIDYVEIARQQAEEDAINDYKVLPDWLKEWSANDAAAYVHDNVLNGFDAAGVDAYVDNLPATVEGMKTGLKQIGGALVAIRDILEIIAKLLMYIRDLVIRFRK